ncbi:MAG: TrpB-like pyridoxal phosphate-dependent enzyme [Armatimonadetes bacterium]|nr:TrpB-like pyridoxal phosphate-dependent enzyme [Armatimonadota bacterium]
MTARRIDLSYSDMPQSWYNIAPDLPRPPDPPLHPGTKQPIGPEDMAPIFPMALLAQEMSADPFIEIPDEVRHAYALYRPTPVYRAVELEKALDTPAHIYYKHEWVSPAGSHKPNTAIPQAFYNKMEGTKRITTETGAGQWGSALSMACQMFDMECVVYMVGISYDQKPYRRTLMETWGATCFRSPSERTNIGRKFLAEDPQHPGSLGIAITEALEDCVQRDDTKYSLGSVLNHVMLHQTIIGQEAMKQMEIAGEYPDIVIGCFGGGSNFAGIAFPFAGQKIKQGKDTRIIAVEPAAAPTLTRGPYKYDFGDTGGMTPLLRMFTLGHDFVPAPIHAGGLRYHGAAPLASLLLDEGVIEAVSYNQLECYASAVAFARSESWVVAPETAHAIHAVIVEANKCKETGEEKVILFNLSGHGMLDLSGYEKYLHGELTDYSLPEADIQKSLATVPEL